MFDNANILITGERVVDGFSYASDSNNHWLEGDKLNSWLARLDKC